MVKPNTKKPPKPLRGGLPEPPSRFDIARGGDLAGQLALKLRTPGEHLGQAADALYSAAIEHLKLKTDATKVYGEAYSKLGASQQDALFTALAQNRDHRMGSKSNPLTPSQQDEVGRKVAIIKKAFGKSDAQSALPELPPLESIADNPSLTKLDEAQYLEAVSELNSQQLEALIAANGHSAIIGEVLNHTRQNFPSSEVDNRLRTNPRYSSAQNALRQIGKAHPELLNLITEGFPLGEMSLPKDVVDDTNRKRQGGAFAALVGAEQAKLAIPDDRLDRRDLRKSPSRQSTAQAIAIKASGQQPELLPYVPVRDKPNITTNLNTIDGPYITKQSVAGTESQAKRAEMAALHDQQTMFQKLQDNLNNISTQQGNVPIESGAVDVGVDDSGSRFAQIAPGATPGENHKKINLDMMFPIWRALVQQLSEDGRSIVWGRMTPHQIADGLIYAANMHGSINPETLIPAITRAMDEAPVSLNADSALAERWERAAAHEGKKYTTEGRTESLVQQARDQLRDQYAEIDVDDGLAQESLPWDEPIPEGDEALTAIPFDSTLPDSTVEPVRQQAMVIDQTPTVADEMFQQGLLNEEEYAILKKWHDENPKYIPAPEDTKPKPMTRAQAQARDAKHAAGWMAGWHGQQMPDTLLQDQQSGADIEALLGKLLPSNPESVDAPSGVVAPAYNSTTDVFRGVDRRPALGHLLGGGDAEFPNNMSQEQFGAYQSQLNAILGTAKEPEAMPAQLNAHQWYNSPQRNQGVNETALLDDKANRTQVSGEVQQTAGDPEEFMNNLRASILGNREIQNSLDATEAIVKKPEIQQSPMNMGPSFFTRQSDSGVKELVPQENATQSAIERLLQSLLEQQRK